MKARKNVLSILVMVSLLLTLNISFLLAQDRPITFHTGAVGGLYMEPGTIWASQWERANPGLKVSVILGGSFTNPLVVTKADPNTNVGIADSYNVNASIKGSDDYGNRAPGGIKNLRALWRFNVLSWSHVIARPESIPANVKTIGELLATKPKLRIALKARGSGDEILARYMFEAYGYTYQDLEKMGCRISFNNPADISGLLIDGHADLTVAIVRAPASYVLDMDASIKDLKWLAIEKDVVEKMVRQYGYISGFHPMGIYSTLKESSLSLAFDHVVFVHENMSTDLAYRLTKAVLQDPDRVKSIKALTPFDPKVVWQNTGYPLHPGAEKAFRELGFMK